MAEYMGHYGRSTTDTLESGVVLSIAILLVFPMHTTAIYRTLLCCHTCTSCGVRRDVEVYEYISTIGVALSKSINQLPTHIPLTFTTLAFCSNYLTVFLSTLILSRCVSTSPPFLQPLLLRTPQLSPRSPRSMALLAAPHPVLLPLST
jgi:hypothetical protein